ncbi:metal ABC transporter ATP-binding protein [Candidatus Protochlamydia phocaeensis]|uniref:metal ABC transporter ATP-binding protein n=1 Tax=Candidatus Protochlamydia phocaeensis TaxID=1414722 RepID=UPI000837BC50|nr:ABC transporter ATP-binding protein [Candidatus Protochlamydia phocaeensis]
MDNPSHTHSPSSALRVSQMTVNYGKTPALWDISVSIPEGVLVGIVGPNGAGKSTFIKTALGLIKPISGRIDFFGQPLKQVRQRVAYVPQRESVDWDFPVTVRDLVLMGRYGRLGLWRRPREADRTAADHYLEVVGMSAYANRQISQLSGGQQQRVFLARALLQEADIYFMDEPFTGVDLATETAIVQLLQQLRTKGKTVFVVHHDLSTVERYFDWVMILNVRLIAYGEVEKVFTPHYLNAAYGRSYALFDQALKLSQQKNAGVKN